MKDADDIISGFDCNGGGNAPYVVDFAAARLLDRSGSTCDAYECTIQHRRVFVKRLKAEYRDNPLYRAAFSKEYDLGVSLSHPSLPRYVGFGDDYIVMDFIEGDTLADLMKRGDRRLQNKRFVRKLLTELIDVVDYLHSRNIVHCDIKADNIIISPYRDRSVTLIDLDKAYTSWLDDTSGNPANYDCSGCADGVIDFKGIGVIAEKLGMKRIARACNDSSVTAETLRAISANRNKAARWGLAAVIVGFAIIAPIVSSSDTPPVDAAESKASVITPDTEGIINSPTETITPRPVVSLQKPEIDHAWISAQLKEKLEEVRVLRGKLIEILESDSVTAADKQVAVLEHSLEIQEAGSSVIRSAIERFSDIPEIKVQEAVRGDSIFLRLEKEWLEMAQLSNNWTLIISRHRSDRPVSQPDTTPDAPLSAPHH